MLPKTEGQIQKELEEWGETCEGCTDGWWCEKVDKECDGGGCGCPIILK